VVEKDQVREYLSKLDIHKSMRPNGMHPQVLRKLADVIARPHSIIFITLIIIIFDYYINDYKGKVMTDKLDKICTMK